MTNTFLYARSATKSQLEGKPNRSIQDQLAAMRQYADSQGWEVTGEYVDEGLSGMTDRRPGFQRMMEDVLSGCVDVILVEHFSRLFRSHFYMEMYRRKLEKKGIQTSSLTDKWGKNESQVLMTAISSLTDEWGKNDSQGLMTAIRLAIDEYQKQERARHRRQRSRPKS